MWLWITSNWIFQIVWKVLSGCSLNFENTTQAFDSDYHNVHHNMFVRQTYEYEALVQHAIHKE